MYKNSIRIVYLHLVLKIYKKNRGSLKSYRKKSGRTTGGSLNNLNNYLLSLINGVPRMSVKPKKHSKSTRGGTLNLSDRSFKYSFDFWSCSFVLLLKSFKNPF